MLRAQCWSKFSTLGRWAEKGPYNSKTACNHRINNLIISKFYFSKLISLLIPKLPAQW